MVDLPGRPALAPGRARLLGLLHPRVVAVDPAGRSRNVCQVANQPSGLGWLLDGRLLAVSMLDRKLLRLDPAGLALHTDLSGLAHSDCNDMVVCSTAGPGSRNFGFIHRLAEDPRLTCVVRVDPDGRAEVAAEDLFPPTGRRSPGRPDTDRGRDLGPAPDRFRPRARRPPRAPPLLGGPRAVGSRRDRLDDEGAAGWRYRSRRR